MEHLSPIPPRDQCVVVGIGASAGGLESFKRLLQQVPDDTGMAFVLVQHLDPTHKSLMVELLAKYTSMPVLQVNDAMPIQPNHVYMIPPNKFIRIEKGGLFLEKPITKRGIRLPIDHFFRSLAESRQERAICVVLSGTGSDGADGLKNVKAEGGMTIVQTPDDAEYDGMPRSAIATGSVDFICPIQDMVQIIIPYSHHPYVQTRPRGNLAESAPDHFRAILNLLRVHTDQDFSRYKNGTITRRIERRMGIRHINQPSDYLTLLRQDGDELQALFRDMLIGVTRFFREPKTWNELAGVISRRILEKPSEEPFRVWVPGCSTGEEAYTWAMLLFDQQERQGRRLNIQIFGTDIDSEAIDKARLGIYPEAVTKDIKDSHVDNYFHREGDKLRVKKKLRESCIFAAQNLLSDPPFSGLDVVSCRNLLIYLEPDIQQRVFDMFHFALKPDGLLLLGSSESPSKRRKLFKTLSQKSRIYTKVGDSKPGAAGFPVDGSGARQKLIAGTEEDQESEPSVGIVERSKKALLDQFAPASVVVDQQGMIQFIHGSLRQYLDFPSGEPDLDLTAMAIDGLKSAARRALQRVKRDNEVVTIDAPSVRRDGKTVGVQIRVQPLSRGRESSPLFLFSFSDTTSPEDELRALTVFDAEGASENEDGDEGKAQPYQQLALELQATREDLQSTIEEVESANEELKASNEEVMSMNEELQSTNEELETSREELQSLNEELSTVNNQLHDKVEELESTNNDLANLLASTDVATLFLDNDLRIRRYTPATIRLMSLLDTDIGRPLSDLAPRVSDPDLETDAREVLEKLIPVEMEVCNSSGNWYMRRITPFRTAENKIEGVVVTFSNVTRLKLALKRIEYREQQQATVAQLGRTALARETLENLFDQAVRGVARTLDVEYCKILQLTDDQKYLTLLSGVGWHEGLVGQAIVPNSIESQAGFTVQSAGPVIVPDLPNEKRFTGPPLLDDHEVISGISVVIGPETSPWGVLGAHSKRRLEFTVDDANFIQAVSNLLWEAIARHESDTKLANRLAEIDTLYNASPTGLCFVNTDLEYVRINDQMASINGRSADDHIGRTVREVVPDLADTVEPIYRQVIQSGEPALNVEVTGTRPSDPDKIRHWIVSFAPLLNQDNHVLGVNTMVLDITRRKHYETALQNSQARLERLIDSASIGIAFAHRDGTVLQANDAMLDIFSITRQKFEEKGWDWQDRVLPRDETFADRMQRLGKDKSSEAIELKREDADGSVVWVLASARPLVDEGDEYVAFLVDITAQKEAELALAESEERLRVAAQVADFGTFYGDLLTKSFTWSPELRQILGVAPDDTISVDLDEVPKLVHPEDRQRVEAKIKSSVNPNGHGQFQDEFRIVRPDGEVRWILMQGSTIFRGKGNKRRPSRIAGIALDITQRHQYEDQLKEARRAAESANAAKSQFLANMSHEIRTPMTAILGYADVLRGKVKDDDAQACIKTIRENGDYLCEIINDILDLSKIESGKMTVHRQQCDVLAILANVRSLMSVRATQKSLDLSVELQGEIPKTIETDPKFFRQVMLNLIGNAIKFTERGTVRVTVRCLPDLEQLEVSVRDTGVGISQYDLEKLFQPFEQADNSTTRKAGGTGLGLSISKRLVEMLGGQIAAESELDRGSTFRFSVAAGPLADVEWVTDADTQIEESNSTLDPTTLPAISGRILAVDDRRDIRFLVETFLTSAGADVETREDGSQAVQAWIAARDRGEKFSAVVMDMQMPVMDGVEATKRLRAEKFTGPIIALTANAMQSDREKCLQAGSNDFVSKPIDKSDLILKLAAWIDGDTNASN